MVAADLKRFTVPNIPLMYVMKNQEAVIVQRVNGQHRSHDVANLLASSVLHHQS